MALTARGLLGLGAIVAIAGLVVAGRPYLTLYDGVVPNEPYRYLHPGPGQAGEPTTASVTVKIVDGGNDLVAAATAETEPQAQVFVVPMGLTLPAGTTQINVSITAVEPPGQQPTDGHLAGNVYAITLTNQAAAPISARADAQASIELRAPDPGTTTATIERFDGTAWHAIQTEAAGMAELFTGVVTDFGDFAIVLPGTIATPGEPGPSSETSQPLGPSTPAATEAVAVPPGSNDRETLTLVLGAAAVAIVLLVAAVALLPGRGRRPPPARGTRGGGARPRR